MPRFDSFEEGDIEEIIQEICCSDPTGPYFVVGGRFIRPDEIVSFQGPEESPTFTLKDGSTVTHNRFEQEENGDLLFRALRVIRRPPTKSQAIKPNYNRIALGSVGYLDPSGANLGNYTNVATYGEAIGGYDPAAGYVFTLSSNTGLVARRDVDGSNPQTIDMTGGLSSIDSAFICERRDTQEIYATVLDGSGSVHVTKNDYDGSNPQTVFSGLGWQHRSDAVQQNIIDEGEGIGFHLSYDELYSFQLDGSSTSNLGTVGERGPMAIDKENKRLFIYYSGRQISVWDYQGNQLNYNSIGEECNGLDYLESLDRLIFYDPIDQKVRTVNPDATDVQDQFTTSGGLGLRAGLDLSAI